MSRLSFDTFNVALAVLLAIPAALGAFRGLSSSEPGWRAIGAASSVMLLGLMVATGMGVELHEQMVEAKRGWNLIPVVVADDDLEPGTAITFDMISQRAIPEQFVFDSYVQPARANEIVGQRLRGHLHAGDPITWASVGTGLAPNACALNPR